MLRFRNTYKTSKKMLWEGVFAILFLLLMIFALAFSFIISGALQVILIIASIILYLSHVFLFFLLILENNNYKLKFVLQKKKFKQLCDEEFSYGKVDYTDGEKKLIKQNFKDNFFQFGTLKTPEQIKFENSPYFLFMQDQKEFNYSNARDKEKFEYLVSTLNYGLVYSCGFLDIFKKWKVEPFTKTELTNLLTKNDFFSSDLVATMKKVINAYEKYKKYNFSDKEIDDYFSYQLQEQDEDLSKSGKLKTHESKEILEKEEKAELSLDDKQSEKYEFLDYIEGELFDKLWDSDGEIHVLITKLAEDKYSK